METVTYEIFGSNRHERHTKERVACRGIIVQGDKILMAKESRSGYLMIPGGGMEQGEKPEECCLREIEEETGFRARIESPLAVIHEFYEEYKYTSYYFVCRIVGEGEKKLTDLEMERGLIPVWLPLEEAVSIFQKHIDPALSTEEMRGICKRELTAIRTFLKNF